uniref:Interleukin-33 n=1 Tax=Microcebus murinus TaxID=30608 RepID=A0A8C5XMN1_MICMU
MKPKMKYSTKKISVAKLNSTANKALVKPYELIKKVLLRYYESQRSSSESGDDVDGKMLMVNLGPPTKDHWLHANNKEHSVELHKSEKPLPEQAFFVLHKQPFKSVSSECVSFECKNYPGTYLGVKDNQLALIKVDCSESLSSENIMFKLSKT